jgi:hypothetical protein
LGLGGIRNKVLAGTMNVPRGMLFDAAMIHQAATSP